MTQRQVIEYYQQKDRVEEYERMRFATIGGRLVEEKEKSIVQKFSNAASKGNVLDLGTGTGRIAASVQSKMKVGIDSSKSMLQKARKKKIKYVVCSDLQHLPFNDATFTAAIAIRVFIREKDLLPLFSEAARVLREEGCFIFDTSNKFSLGIFLNLLSQEPRHEMFLGNEIVRMLKMSSFKIFQAEPAFIIPRGFYQKINSNLVRVLWKIDSMALKTGLRRIACTHFWRASRANRKRNGGRTN